MCVAIAQRKNAATLTEDELNRGWNTNPDGGGYAFIDRTTNKILIRKFMKKKAFIKAYLRDHAAHGANSPFIVHMRIATHGKVMEDTAHPFRVEAESGEMVFAHNGIIDEVTDYTSETTSDTMAFRDLFLDELPDDWLDNMAIRELVENYIGWSKLVVLTNSDLCADEIYVINESAGDWVKDTWFSNNSCKLTLGVYGGKTYKDYDSWFQADKDKDDLSDLDLPTGAAMSAIERDYINDMLISTDAETIIDEASRVGYCPYCLWDPCKCEDTCYYCNNRKMMCKCATWVSIDNMLGWVGVAYFHQSRREELQYEWDKEWDVNVSDYTPRSAELARKREDITEW